MQLPRRAPNKNETRSMRPTESLSRHPKMFRTSLLFVTFFFASYADCAAVPDPSDNGRGSGLRDWMRNMKDRMMNREPGRMGMGLMADMGKMKLPTAVVSMVTGDRMFQPVNLANLKFDPLTDRAYRMGNWYMIRRRGTSTNKDDSADDWSAFFDKKDDTKWEVAVPECVIKEPKRPTKKESSEVEELSAEVLNPTV